MKRLACLLLLIALPAIAIVPGMERAKLHAITFRGPAVNFFQGAVLGNGGLGAIVTTRPDAIVIYFGHNNVWDIRVAENNRDKIGSFPQVFAKIKAIPDSLSSLEQDPWYKEYSLMARENYAKPYPRPFPCGALLLGFQRQSVEVLGHSVDISTGLCQIDLLVQGEPAIMRLFTRMDKDQLWFRITGKNGRMISNPFERIRLIPDPSTPKEFPSVMADKQRLCFTQILPYAESCVSNVKDRAFRLAVSVNPQMGKITRIDWEGNPQPMGDLEYSLAMDKPLIGFVQLAEGMASTVSGEKPDLSSPDSANYTAVWQSNVNQWEQFWQASSIMLDDKELEKIWYHNLYFINCSLKPGVNCPGLFANWSYDQIGTAWHGDYHMNYNTQQAFWATFSSNHLEKNLPYVQMIERLMPVSLRWAREYYQMPGAYFPHSAYPVEMTMNAYPVPTWGWEVCETPWSVQGLWWHYLYSRDLTFLKEHAFTPIKEAVQFLAAYMTRPDAHGAQWKDNKYHIFPTVPPELYGLKPGFKYNYDCLVDLTLSKFVFNAYLQAAELLGVSKKEMSLIKQVRTILQNYPDYPLASSAYGDVLVSVPGERAETVYNVPNPLMIVFPGEEYGLHSAAKELALVRNTWKNMQIEGGNELVFANLQGARIGMLDLEKFKRQVRYCELANGSCTDMVLQVHGRYSDLGAYDFMAPMGLWFENFGLPVVINECLMQSYNGEIRLFPNWPKDKNAEFHTLRAAGAFLISAELKNGMVRWLEILSEKGGDIQLISPWGVDTNVNLNGKPFKIKSEKTLLQSKPGQILRLQI